MKALKTAAIIIALILILSILLYFFPPKKLIGKLPFLNRFYNNTTIEIISQKGKAKVWIDEKDHGETPITTSDLPEGTYLIEMEKIAPENSFYKKHSFNIELSKNTTARIDMEIGPEELLHGTILYYTPTKTSDQKGYLVITTNSQDAKISLNGEFMKRGSLTNLELNNGEYQVKVEGEGYQEIQIPVFVREGYQLNLKVYQFPIPIGADTLEETRK